MVPMNLIWSELAQWLRNSGIRKIPRALIMAKWPKWANDHDARYLLAKTIPMNLIQSESAQWLQSYGVLKDWADWLDKWTDGRTDRDNSIVMLFSFRKGGLTSVNSLWPSDATFGVMDLGQHWFR